MALDGVAVVVLEGVGIDVLPAVHDLAVGGAVPSRAGVAGFKEDGAPPVVDAEVEVLPRQSVHVQYVVEPVAVG